MDNLLDAEGIIEIFKSNSDTLKGNRVMILDDVERCKIPLDELFGFINSIVEHSNSKIILICDEEKLDEVANKEGLATEYKDFKEKLVGQTFALEVSYADVAGQFIDKLSNPIINSNRDLIIDLFIASKRENLRLMRHCLIDIKRFFEQIPENIKENSNYDQFVKNILYLHCQIWFLWMLLQRMLRYFLRIGHSWNSIHRNQIWQCRYRIFSGIYL